MSICVVCDKNSPFADASRGWTIDPMIGPVCPQCRLILSRPVRCDGVVSHLSFNEQSRLRSHEYADAVAMMTRTAREIVSNHGGQYVSGSTG